MDVIYVGAAAFLGGMITALLGWTESAETFDVKKFMSSVIRSVVGAVVIAAAYDYSGAANPIIAYLMAFLAGAGVDAGGNRVAGAIAARNK